MKGYSDLKVIHNLPMLSKLKLWRNKRVEDEDQLSMSDTLRASVIQNYRPTPGQIQLILSDLCNHDCSFCAYRLSGYTSNQNFDKTLQMPTEKAEEIIRDAATLGVSGVQFTGGGEPTVHKDHLRIMRSALELDLACAMVTNGNLLRPGWEEVFPRFKWIRVSIDAGNAQDYASIRRVKESAWPRLWDNVRAMVNAGCNVGTSFIVTKDNWRGIYKACERAKVAGVKYIRIGAFYNPDMEDYYDVNLRASIEDAIAMAQRSFGTEFVFDQFTKRVEYMTRKPEFSFCGYQQLNVYVGADQKVYRCCEYAYNDHGYVGDLTQQSFYQWFQSQEADQAYRCFDATKCVTCPFHSKNELLEFMTRDDISDLDPEFP